MEQGGQENLIVLCEMQGFKLLLLMEAEEGQPDTLQIGCNTQEICPFCQSSLGIGLPTPLPSHFAWLVKAQEKRVK